MVLVPVFIEAAVGVIFLIGGGLVWDFAWGSHNRHREAGNPDGIHPTGRTRQRNEAKSKGHFSMRFG